MHAILWIFLTFYIFIFPGIALFPSLIYSSRLAVSIPVISAFILYGVKEILYGFNLYSNIWFNAVLVTLFLCAIYRVNLLRNKETLSWPKEHLVLYAINFFILIPAILYLYTTIYNSDELSSWSLWAVQHYLGERPDFSFTNAPYPQIFSVTIANIYKVIGSTQYHYLTKSLIAIFPFALLTALSLSALKSGKKISFAIAISLFTATFFYYYFIRFFAEQLMVPALVISIYFLLIYFEKQDPKILVVCVLCAGVAVLSKQQAALWSLFCLPALILCHLKKSSHKALEVSSILFILFLVLAWYFFEGQGVIDNRGVIKQSRMEENIFKQLLWGCRQFFIYHPNFTVLLILAIYTTTKNIFTTLVWIFFIVPGIILWFMFGTYGGFRLGLHVIAVLFLIICIGHFKKDIPWIDNLLSKMDTKIGSLAAHANTFVMVSVVIFVVSFETTHFFRKTKDGVGYENTIRWMLEENPQKGIDFFYQPGLRLLVTDAPMTSIFYENAYLVRPKSDATQIEILEQIKREKPGFVAIPYWRDLRSIATTTNDIFLSRCKELISPYIKEPGTEIARLDLSRLDGCIEKYGGARDQ